MHNLLVINAYSANELSYKEYIMRNQEYLQMQQHLSAVTQIKEQEVIAYAMLMGSFQMQDVLDFLYEAKPNGKMQDKFIGYLPNEAPYN